MAMSEELKAQLAATAKARAAKKRLRNPLAKDFAPDDFKIACDYVDDQLSDMLTSPNATEKDTASRIQYWMKNHTRGVVYPPSGCLEHHCYCFFVRVQSGVNEALATRIACVYPVYAYQGPNNPRKQLPGFNGEYLKLIAEFLNIDPKKYIRGVHFRGKGGFKPDEWHRKSSGIFS
jgi:hypothetical protein